MKTVYICEPYGVLHRNIDTLVLRRSGYKIAAIPMYNVSVIVVFGTLQITTQVFKYLFESGIDLVFMSSHGKILGRVQSEKSSNVILRIAQFKAWQDMERRLSYAKIILQAKIRNQQYMIKKYAHYKTNIRDELKSAAADFNHSCDNIVSCRSLDEIMGVEGSCAKRYFQCFPAFLSSYEFPGRQQHPGREPVNAMLNLAYAFLAHEIERRLTLYSFDTELGFIHGIRYGCSSLVLDLMEEFRPVFIDAFIIRILNKKLITPDEFDTNDEGCKLRTSALKKFCSLYQEHLLEKQKGKTWEQHFNDQIDAFRRSLLTGEVYKPYQQM